MEESNIFAVVGALIGLIIGIGLPALWYFVRKEKRDVAVKMDIESIKKCVTDGKEATEKKDKEITDEINQLKGAVNAHMLQSAGALATLGQHTEQLRDHEKRIRKLEE